MRQKKQNGTFSLPNISNGKGKVRAKKRLGQHFLTDENIAGKIANTLSLQGYKKVLEIGPGMGMLTKYLLEKPVELYAVELDTEAVLYLQRHYPQLINKIVHADFLTCDTAMLLGDEPFAVTGNFPYNISSQILFKVLELKHQIPEFSGMFQKEVAQRICEKEGSKSYGILSVFIQAFYEAEYLFTVAETVFTPPPKVKSGVIRLRRKKDYRLPCSETLFFKVVKTAFNQRRKTLRNSLKTLNLPLSLKEDSIFGLRPEQLSVQHFVALTLKIEDYAL